MEGKSIAVLPRVCHPYRADGASFLPGSPHVCHRRFVTQLEAQEMPSIIRDAKSDCALSGIVCKLRQEHVEFCDFVREFPPSLRSEKGRTAYRRCAEPSHTKTHARIHRRLAEVRGADLPRTLTHSVSPARAALKSSLILNFHCDRACDE